MFHWFVLEDCGSTYDCESYFLLLYLNQSSWWCVARSRFFVLLGSLLIGCSRDDGPVRGRIRWWAAPSRLPFPGLYILLLILWIVMVHLSLSEQSQIVGGFLPKFLHRATPEIALIRSKQRAQRLPWQLAFRLGWSYRHTQELGQGACNQWEVGCWCISPLGSYE